MRLLLVYSLFSLLFFACGADSTVDEKEAEVALESLSAPNEELTPSKVCLALSRATIKKMVPEAISISPQPVQGATGMIRCGANFILNGEAMEATILMQKGKATVEGFAQNKQNLMQVAQASNQPAPQDIPGLEGEAFVYGGKNGGVEYLKNGNLWSIAVRDKQGMADVKLSADLFAEILAQ